ncbi:MAG: hypothetical protein Q9190_001158 [Brigantiaea leucoxantha]
MQDLNSHDLYEITLQELQLYLSFLKFSSVEYVKFCVDRINKVNPYLEAVIETNPDAMVIAEKLDGERKNGVFRGQLHGIPVLVKDNIATNDSMQTTAGSWSLLGSTVLKDAFVVSRLREAGAVILGHANMSEWSSVRSKEYSTGYSPRGGQTRNPFKLSASPFGSSSGSAVAVSANLVPLALGTETDTSIIGPASINGVVGLKPTVGLTSRSGIIPISRNLDTVGCFGRTVADVAYGLDAIAESDKEDQATCVAPRPGKGSYGKCLTSCKKAAERVFKIIVEAGAEIAETDFPCAEERIASNGIWDWELGEPQQSEFTVVKVDAYDGINHYLSQLKNTEVKSVEDVIAYNERNRGSEGAWPGDHQAWPSGQDNLREIVNHAGKEDETYRTALDYIHQKTRAEGIDGALKHTNENGEVLEFEALLLCDRNGAGQQLAAQAGYPIICIPIGLDDSGMPVSLSLQHSAWKEEQLIKWASAIEDLIHERFGWRPCPEYKDHMSKNIPINRI